MGAQKGLASDSAGICLDPEYIRASIVLELACNLSPWGGCVLGLCVGSLGANVGELVLDPQSMGVRIMQGLLGFF